MITILWQFVLVAAYCAVAAQIDPRIGSKFYVIVTLAFLANVAGYVEAGLRLARP